ncbi:SET domain-containing protein SmydA-8 [Anabrus simplex]|uniref:SET domain-containing protein SmydA-8 n=1 Tax=Anabrus simplex TaxID=316456 RepID=UPI0035A2D1CA
MPQLESVKSSVTDVCICINSEEDKQKNISHGAEKTNFQEEDKAPDNDGNNTESKDFQKQNSIANEPLTSCGLHLNDFNIPEDFDEVAVTEDVLERMLREYLGDNDRNSPWTIKKSPISGRGVFATRDLNPGDLVFCDVPLALGPRAGSSCPLICVGCHKTDSFTFTGCTRGCGLPVCSAACETAPRHRAECQLLHQPGRTQWSARLLRGLTPLRCLLLPPDKKKILLCLQAHQHSQHAFEVEYIKNEVTLSPTEECFLKRACCTLDSNAFRASTSLRGLYPLGSLLNHQCTPNTQHGYDEDNRLVVRTAVFVPAGVELTNSYTPLLWSTQARRHNLAFIKHFACNCLRCQDPQEMGARLGALPCARDGCPGAVLSVDPLLATTKWRCDVCGIIVPGRQAALVQNTLGNLLESVNQDDPQQVANFLLRQQGVLPQTNQVVVEMKRILVELYGHREGWNWAELTDCMLTHKESLCRELLELVRLLGAGQCKLRGIFLYELHCTLMEKLRRMSLTDDGLKNETRDVFQEALAAIQEAVDIFKDDSTAPSDARRRLEDALKSSWSAVPA